MIFQMSADGYGYGEIIDKLNSLNYKTKKGNQFGKNSLYDLIKNERYKGTFTFNKRSSPTSLNKRNNHKYKEDKDVIRIENGCPAIVSKNLWECANTGRKLSSKIATNAKNNYLLTGLLYCSECGAKMHGNQRNYNGNKYATYRCNKKENNRNCSSKEIRADIVDKFVVGELIDSFFNDGIIPQITKEINDKIKTDLYLSDENVIQKRQELRELEISRNNLVDTLAVMGNNKTITDKLNVIEVQITECNNYIEKLNKEIDSLFISENDVKSKLDELKQYMLKPSSFTKTKLVLREYIDKVEIGNSKVKVTFKVTFTFTYYGEIKEISSYCCKENFKKNMLQINGSVSQKPPQNLRNIENLPLFFDNLDKKNSRCIYHREFCGGGEESRTLIEQ